MNWEALFEMLFIGFKAMIAPLISITVIIILTDVGILRSAGEFSGWIIVYSSATFILNFLLYAEKGLLAALLAGSVGALTTYLLFRQIGKGENHD